MAAKDEIAGKFARLFEKALTDTVKDREKTKKDREKDYYALTYFINVKLKTKGSLDACLEKYLEIYIKFSPKDRRSLFVFALILRKRLEKSDTSDKFVEDLTYRSDNLQRPFTPLQERLESLEQKEKNEIKSLLESINVTEKNSQSIIDELKTAFSKSVGNKNPSAQDLYNFDSLPDKNLKADYEKLVANCNSTWRICIKDFNSQTFDSFTNAFSKFTKFLDENKKKELALFQILKWIRVPAIQPIVEKRGNETHITGGSPDYLVCELYLQTVNALFLRALTVKKLPKNYSGFTIEEVSFFFDPLQKTEYYSDLINRFKFARENVPRFSELTDFYLYLILHAKSKSIDLLSDDRTKEIFQKLKTAPKDKLKEKRFSTRGYTNYEADKGELKIGDKISTGQHRFTIIYFEGEPDRDSPIEFDPTIYVEYDKIKGYLFKMTIHTFTSRLEDAKYILVWEDNKHLLKLIPAYFQFLGYAYTFITGGFVGLIKEIIEDAVVPEVMDKISELPGGDAYGISTVGGGLAALRMAGQGKLNASAAVREARHELGTLADDSSKFLRRETDDAARLIENTGNRTSTRALGQGVNNADEVNTLAKNVGDTPYQVENVTQTAAYKKLTDRGFKSVEKTGLDSTDYGRFQKRITGSSYETHGVLKDGTLVQLDGMAVSETGTGKLVALEAKLGREWADYEKSGHLKFWESKVPQMKKYAQFARENSDIIERVDFVCSRRFVGETYLNIKELLPKNLQKYIEINWVD